MHESRLRSLAKGITFRILASCVTALLFFAFTNDHTLALGFGALDFLVKLALYYAHERAWLRVPEGFFRSRFGEIANLSIAFPKK